MAEKRSNLEIVGTFFKALVTGKDHEVWEPAFVGRLGADHPFCAPGNAHIVKGG
jgi:hypothetical protein